MKYIVKTLYGNITICEKESEVSAIRAGRKFERYCHKIGRCGQGFFVYNEAGNLIRKQICNNFGENWRESK